MRTNEARIIEAIEKLANKGINPTIERVRSEVGSGSNSTISPILSTWKSEQEKLKKIAESAPKVIVNQLERYANEIWSAANELANTRLDADRTLYKTEVEKYVQTIRDLENEAIDMEMAKEKLQNDKDIISAQHRDAQKQIKQLHLDLAAMTKRTDAAEIELNLVNKRLDELKTELAAALSKNDELLKILATPRPSEK